MNIFEDRLLIRRFKGGDCGALRRIYEKYRCELLKLAVVMTNDVGFAEDAVQDVFVNFVRSIGRIEPHGNLKNYLATSVVNQIRNMKRNAARKPTSQLNNDDCAVSILPSGLAPMMLERSLQAQFLIPMAISLAFGVMFATMITLLLVPALYKIVEDVKVRFFGFAYD